MRGKPRLLLLALSGALVIGGVVTTGLWCSGRIQYPESERRAAWSALARSRASGAVEWAPEAMDRAESAYRAAVGETENQSRRWLPLRNYGLSRNRYDCAVTCAARAEIASERAHRTSEETARGTLERSRDLSRRVDALMHAQLLTPLGERRRRQAQAFLAESGTRFRRGAYAVAENKAIKAGTIFQEVLEQTRKRGDRFLDPAVSRTWSDWLEDTVARSRATRSGAILIIKDKNRLDLYHAGERVRSYQVDLGRNRLARKLVAGDNATPEGRYRIVTKKGLGKSRYHMALLLDYPTEADRRRLDRARQSGEVPRKSTPGRNIEIHGHGGLGSDWTEGCIAISNPEMEDLFGRVVEGTPVTIVGNDGVPGSISRFMKDLNAGIRGQR